MRSILTEKNLAGYRRANPGIRFSRASQAVDNAVNERKTMTFEETSHVYTAAQQATAADQHALASPSISTIRQSLTQAYGKLVDQLEQRGLITLSQTQEQAIEAAAQVRAEVTGVSVEQAKAELMASVKKSAAMRLWIGSRTVNDAVIPETPEYKGNTTGDLAHVPTGAKIPAGPLRVTVGYAPAPHRGRGITHMADNAQRNFKRMPVNQTGDLTEDLMREAVAVMAGVTQTHNDGSYIFVNPRMKKAIVANYIGNFYSIVSVRPYNSDTTALWGTPEWRGRLTFPSRETATASPSTTEHQDKLSHPGRAGLEVHSEKFDVTSEGEKQQAASMAATKGQRTIDIKRSANGAVQGFFDPQTGQSFLIADNLSAEAAPGVLMHEVGIHMAADGSMAKLFNRAKMLLKAQKGSAFMQGVQAKLDAAGETSAEEVAAYMVEAHENDRAQAPASVKRWLADLLATVKAWLHNKGIVGADSLTVADIAAVARANAKSMTRGDVRYGVKFSRNGNFDPTNPDIRYSRQPSDDMFASTGGIGNFLSIMNAPRQGVADPVKQELVAGVRATAEAIRAAWGNAPEVEVAFDMNDPIIPQAVRDADLEQRSRGATGDPEGFYFDGKVYLLASRLTNPEDAARVTMHEALGHYGLHGVFGTALGPLLDQMAAMRPRDVAAKAISYGLYDRNQLGGLAPDKASPSQILAAMTPKQRRVAAEEVLAEMAQDQPTLGFVQRAIAAIRTWLRNHMPMLDSLAMTDEEIINSFILPARRFVEFAAESSSWNATIRKAFSPTFSMMGDAGKRALAEFAKTDDLFTLPKSTKDTLEGIVADNDARFIVSKPMNIGGRLDYTIAMPDGTKATVSVRDPDPYGRDQIYDTIYTDDGIELVFVRPGENPEDVPPTGDVWIDVSALKKGDFGALMYNIAATYAHNTGRIFIGDPHGLSKDALRRRLEHMISSALKFGTTAHLAPHPDQTRGGHGVPPLRWVYGDDVGNVERMIAVSVQALDNGFPQSKLIEYRADGNFYNAKTGVPISRGGLAVRVAGAIGALRGTPGGDGGTGQAGWRTVARAALFRYLQSAIGDASSTISERGSILARAGSHVSRLDRGETGNGPFVEKERIFYSRRVSNGLTNEAVSNSGKFDPQKLDIHFSHPPSGKMCKSAVNMHLVTEIQAKTLT